MSWAWSEIRQVVDSSLERHLVRPQTARYVLPAPSTGDPFVRRATACVQCQDMDLYECNALGVNSQAYVERVNTEFQKIGLMGTTLLAASGVSCLPRCLAHAICRARLFLTCAFTTSCTTRFFVLWL